MLLDYASWAEKKGISYSTFSTHQIRLSDLKEIAKECNVTFKRGDILFVRIGVTKEWDTVMTDDQKRAYSLNPKPEHAGVEATTDVLRWIWDNGFCAVASDAISWEVRSQNANLPNLLQLRISGLSTAEPGRVSTRVPACRLGNAHW